MKAFPNFFREYMLNNCILTDDYQIILFFKEKDIVDINLENIFLYTDTFQGVVNLKVRSIDYKNRKIKFEYSNTIGSIIGFKLFPLKLLEPNNRYTKTFSNLVSNYLMHSNKPSKIHRLPKRYLDMPKTICTKKHIVYKPYFPTK